MMNTILLFDVAPVGGGIAAVFGVVFFFVLAAIAFITYRMMKKTVKMAVRMTIVVAILIIALVGSVALLLFGAGGKKSPTRPTPTNQRR
jgi:phosphoglycerol transferase MdoB-like AlkP superfamily enzyme